MGNKTPVAHRLQFWRICGCLSFRCIFPGRCIKTGNPEKQVDQGHPPRQHVECTPAGRKRWYTRPDKSDPDYRRKISKIQREAKNHPIQGTNADALKYALVFISERMKKEGIDGGITHTVHDEIVTEVREDQAEEWAKIQSEEMVRAGKLFIKKVEVVSDPFVGDVWEH